MTNTYSANWNNIIYEVFLSRVIQIVLIYSLVTEENTALDFARENFNTGNINVNTSGKHLKYYVITFI